MDSNNSEKQKKSGRISLRLTPQQKKLVQTVANDYNVSMTQVLLSSFYTVLSHVNYGTIEKNAEQNI